jgi:hypothetical protein
VFEVAARTVIFTDSVILMARAVSRRVFKLGPSRVFSVPALPDKVSILYFDMGTHRNGGELLLMVDEILPRMSRNYVGRKRLRR